MSKDAERTDTYRAALHTSLERLAERLRACKSARHGEIVFRLSGQAAGNYCIECTAGHSRVVESPGAGADRQPLVEIMGDAETIVSIINGDKDARQQFLAGGLRVRGDLRYFSDLALELGVLRSPL